MEKVDDELRTSYEKLMTEVNDTVLETVKKRKEHPKEMKKIFEDELQSHRKRLKFTLNEEVPTSSSTDESPAIVTFNEAALNSSDFMKKIESLIDRATNVRHSIVQLQGILSSKSEQLIREETNQTISKKAKS